MSDTVKSKQPKYRRHKSSGQAIVTLPDGQGGRKDYLLGPYGTAASKREYHRLVGEWVSRGRRLPAADLAGDLSVNEVLLAYAEQCAVYYRGPDGKPTHELANVKAALRHVKELYGDTTASAFDSVSLDAIRHGMIEKEYCRRRINQDVGRIKRCFKWAGSKKLIPASVFHDLQTLEGLRAGRSHAKESDPVKPVPVAHVNATLPYLSNVVADMVELQLHTAMRAGELVIMRGIDLDTTGKVWIYTPERHKNLYRGHQRPIAMGPKAQEIVRRHLKADVTAYLFSPRDSMGDFRQQQRAARKSKMQPSQQDRSKAKPKKKPGTRYTSSTYAQAIQDGCRKADHAAHEQNRDVPAGQVIVPAWTSHRLRHTAASLIQREYGIEAARACLGHRSPMMTALYAELDTAKAAEVMGRIG